MCYSGARPPGATPPTRLCGRRPRLPKAPPHRALQSTPLVREKSRPQRHRNLRPWEALGSPKPRPQTLTRKPRPSPSLLPLLSACHSEAPPPISLPREPRPRPSSKKPRPRPASSEAPPQSSLFLLNLPSVCHCEAPPPSRVSSEAPPPAPSPRNLRAAPPQARLRPRSDHCSAACAKSPRCAVPALTDARTDARTDGRRGERRSQDLAAAVSRSGRSCPRPAFVTVLDSPTEPGDPRVPARPTSGTLGRDRGRSAAIGAARVPSAPRAHPARTPLLAELGTVMLRGPLPHLGAEPGDRGGIRRGRGARSTETFPLAAAPQGCLHPCAP